MVRMSCVILIIIVCGFQKSIGTPGNWRVVELIAERHPYVVALLNESRDYVCTGSIIGEQTVLTSGRCSTRRPVYVSAGTAVLGRHNNKHSQIPICHTKLHVDYVFELKPDDPTMMRIHSNIALVYTCQPLLLIFLSKAEIGNYYASELRDKQLAVIGYGSLRSSNVISLQRQWYHQSPCLNPKWYYCVCGFEYTTIVPTYDLPFGEGAPVTHMTDIVAMAVLPCGMLLVPSSNIKYNIFTVIGPYRSWIDKPDSFLKKLALAANSGYNEQMHVALKYIYVFLLISKLLF